MAKRSVRASIGLIRNWNRVIPITSAKSAAPTHSSAPNAFPDIPMGKVAPIASSVAQIRVTCCFLVLSMRLTGRCLLTSYFGKLGIATRVRWVQVRPDNHWLDCEVGIMAAAVITGAIKLKDETVKKQVVTAAQPTNEGGVSSMKRVSVR